MLLKELEALLRDRLDIANDSQATFKGRMQNLQRLKFPEGINTGRGKRVDYSWSEIFQIAIAFDLIDAGLAQEVATRLITANRQVIATGMIELFKSTIEKNVSQLLSGSTKNFTGANGYLVCSVNSLREVKNSPQDYQSKISYLGEQDVWSDGQLHQDIAGGGVIIVNLGALMTSILRYLGSNDGAVSQLNSSSLNDWLKNVERDWRSK